MHFKCSECNTAMRGDAKVCPTCGATNPHRPNSASWLVFAFILAVVVGFISVGSIGRAGEQQFRDRDRAAIDRCHNDLAQDSHDSTRRVLRDICEQKSADFLAKYGVDP